MAIKKRAQDPSKMRLNISENMMKILVEYTISYSPSLANLANFRKLLSVLDTESYRYNYEIYNRMVLCNMICDIRLDEGVNMPAIIKERILEIDPTMKETCDTVDWRNDAVIGQDARSVTKYIDKKMQYYYYYVEMPEIIKLWDAANKGGFETAESTMIELDKRVSRLSSIMENSSSGAQLVRKINFSDPDIGEKIINIARIEQAPQTILQTGIRQLNANLGPGFRGGKLYVILGMSGKFKSGTLLNLADQIREFNPHLEDLVEGRRNTILFITAENTINETIERIYNMYADIDAPFLSTDPEIIKETILNKGKYLVADNERGIDLEIQYYSNLEINTGRIYRIIDEMHACGQNVIGVIVDYIKRIDSVFPSNGDETVRVGYVAKELKSLAIYYNIPVITAQQVNRNGNAIIDSAMRDGKADLLRFIGNSDIGSAWAVIEEADIAIMINLERSLKDQRMYLTFKFTKKRYVSQGEIISDYFNHPFANESEIKLMTDVDKEQSVSIMSLATDLETVNQEEYERSAQERPTVVKRVGSSAILDAIGCGTKAVDRAG